VFVGIEEGVDGMVHKSDLSWTVKVNNPADLHHKNDDVEAIILSINHDEKKVSLGIKQLIDDPWPTILNDIPTGTVVEATVISVVDYGIFVRVRDGIEALVASSDIVEDEANKIKVGDKVKVEITALDTVDRRVNATMKNIGAEKTATILTSREAAQKAGTLGDLIKEKLGDKLDETLKR
jgi:small subunit ribosomal protein S1